METLCACGCGLPAPIAKQTNKRLGHVAGRVIKYRQGHGRIKRDPVPYFVIDPDTGCWVWQRSLNNGGYGVLFHTGKNRKAHRVYYEQHHGPIPDGAEIDHLCRNRACVNPAHLEAVGRHENIRRGAATKLNADQVREIRAAYAAGGVTYKVLAQRFGISVPHVCEIVRRVQWKDV